MTLNVFVSYTRKDFWPQMIITSYLQEHGFRVWWDKSMRSGVNFRHEIDRELDKCDVAIVIWSEHSIRSDYVIAEADHAYRCGRKILSVYTNSIREHDIPKPFGNYQTCPLLDYTQLLHGLQQVSGKHTFYSKNNTKLLIDLNGEPGRNFEIIEWLKHEGDHVAPGDPVCTVSNGRKSTRYNWDISGILTDIAIEQGESFDEDRVIAVIDKDISLDGSAYWANAGNTTFLRSSGDKNRTLRSWKKSPGEFFSKGETIFTSNFQGEVWEHSFKKSGIVKSHLIRAGGLIDSESPIVSMVCDA